jgi:hypothetical protein
MTGVDAPTLRRGRAMSTSWSATKKIAQLETILASTTASTSLVDHTVTDIYAGSWSVIAPPALPSLDPSGTPTDWCDAVVLDFGDFGLTLGLNDSRQAKMAADILPGESAFINAFNSRLFLKQKQVGLAAFGGSLLFDQASSTVSLTGVPSKPGAGAAWMKISATQFVACSGSGGAQVTLDGAAAVLRAAKVTLQSLKTDLVDGANDPVITLSLFLPIVQALITWADAHFHTVTSFGPSSPPTTPLSLSPQGSSCVNALP